MSSQTDAATVEVVRNYLSSAANEMQRTLIRTSYNTIIYEILDFGISLYDADLNLIADSPGLTLFLGANDYGLKKGIEYVGEENLEPGDIIIMNYPYWSSAHTLDVCLFAPIFTDEEDLIGYAVIRAHWLDIGAKDSGYVLDSTNIHQEGLIFPGTKIYKAGERDEELFELIRFNSRTPKKVIGDLNAQIAAINIGKRRLKELHQKYGTDTVRTCIEEILDHGERTAREGVAELPDGTWSATGYIDNDGVNDDLVRMEAEVTIDDDSFTVDFSGSEDAVDGPINLPVGMTRSLCKMALKTVTTPNEPSNEGQYEPLSVIAPEGNLFHATYPSPTFTIWTAIVGAEVVYEAMAQGLPDRVPASSGGDLCGIILVGEDPDSGEMFIESSNEGVGWGATEGMDGPNALMHITETRVKNIPIEVFENKAPFQFDKLRLRQDSGGIGEYRGGLGVRRDYRFLDETKGITLIKKTRTDGWGLAGGEPGEKNAVVVMPNTEDEDWEDRFDFLVDNNDLYEATENKYYTGMMNGWFEAGEVLSNRSGGGGGYGDPYDRDPEAVLEDVIDGYVSRQAAQDDYGVVIEDEEIDWEATERLRSD